MATLDRDLASRRLWHLTAIHFFSFIELRLPGRGKAVLRHGLNTEILFPFGCVLDSEDGGYYFPTGALTWA